MSLVREDVYIENLVAGSASVTAAPVNDTDVANKLYVDDVAFDVLNTGVVNVATETTVVVASWASIEYNLKDRIDTTTGAITIEDGESVAFNFSALLDNPSTALLTADALLLVQLTSADGTTTIYNSRNVVAGNVAGPTFQTNVSRNFGYTNTSGAQEVVYLAVRGEVLGVPLVINNHELTANWLKQ